MSKKQRANSMRLTADLLTQFLVKQLLEKLSHGFPCGAFDRAGRKKEGYRQEVLITGTQYRGAAIRIPVGCLLHRGESIGTQVYSRLDDAVLECQVGG